MVKSGYFAKHKTGKLTSIAVGTPKWFKGEKYSYLFPPGWLLAAYKDKVNPSDWGVDYITHSIIKDMSIDEAYTFIYNRDVLSRLNPTKILFDLKGSRIMCWDGYATFCHRHLVMEWLMSHSNLDYWLSILKHSKDISAIECLTVCSSAKTFKYRFMLNNGDSYNIIDLFDLDKNIICSFVVWNEQDSVDVLKLSL